MLLFWLAACAPAQDLTETEAAGPRIVASVFPQYDWLRQIIGDNPGNVQLTLLLARSEEHTSELQSPWN